MSIILLASVLDLASAPVLKQELLDAFARDAAVAIDAAQVQRIGAPCLQILLAAVAQGASIVNFSTAFGEAAGVLDLLPALKLEGPHV